MEKTIYRIIVATKINGGEKIETRQVKANTNDEIMKAILNVISQYISADCKHIMRRWTVINTKTHMTVINVTI